MYFDEKKGCLLIGLGLGINNYFFIKKKKEEEVLMAISIKPLNNGILFTLRVL